MVDLEFCDVMPTYKTQSCQNVSLCDLKLVQLFGMELYAVNRNEHLSSKRRSSKQGKAQQEL